MQFHEAEQKRTELTRQFHQGSITRDQYIAAVNQLRVTDAAGAWWQPDPDGSGWLRWDGNKWISAVPPSGPGAARSPSQSTSQKTQSFDEFKSGLMTMDEFKQVSKTTPLAARPQKWWDLLSILGGVAAAVIWFIYGGLREGFDFLSALLMIAIPVVLVWFRGNIDEMLVPLQPHRKKVPRLILIGLGLVTPFLTAWILYNIFHISQYPLMQANILIGTLVSYVIVRDPILARGYSGPRGPASAVNVSMIFFVLLVSLLAVPVMADDCTRDPLNAQDCLRTSGFAETMAGTAGTGLGVLVNGPIIVQGFVQGGAGTATGTRPVTPAGPPGGTGPRPASPAGAPNPNQALINQRNALLAQQAALRKRWFDRKALEEAVRKAKLLDKKHGIRAIFLGGKKITEGITDPKGAIYDGVKKKLGIETPLDKMKDGFWGKEVEMSDVGKDWKAARQEYQRLKAELDGMPSQRDMLDQNSELNRQISEINAKLAAGGKQ